MIHGQPELHDLVKAYTNDAVKRSISGGRHTVSDCKLRHECTKGLVDIICDKVTVPTEIGQRYLDNTASNLPTRKARRSRFNGAVKVWDEKMPFTQEGESLSGEYPLSLELAHDKRIKRYYFQPKRVALDYVNGNGRRVRTQVTPDCLVATIDGRLAIVEMASDEEVVKECKNGNPRFALDEATGRYIDRPLTEACSLLGIAVVLLRTADVNHVLFQNYLYLGKGFDKQWQPGEGARNFVKFIRDSLAADYVDVTANPRGWKTDDVIGAIARQLVYVDLRCQLLGGFGNARIYASREHADAEASAPEALPLLPVSGLPDASHRPVDLSCVSDAALAEAWHRWGTIKPHLDEKKSTEIPETIATYLSKYRKAAKEHGAGEPPRLSRRLVGVSHAALAYSVICE